MSNTYSRNPVVAAVASDRWVPTALLAKGGYDGSPYINPTVNECHLTALASSRDTEGKRDRKREKEKE
ncbi:hypothetical protein RF55_7033 [Lasius niger]|uniref:Uncharacterized protein n=1 Tax=Lasius niger TaxID=67767 RepID=A0A0J7KRR0_LASNI|nr:hypothetical protein RF55_7033 [Lasius niger]